MTELPHLPSLNKGDRVQSTFLVVERTEKTMAASGDTYVILTLGNRTGTLETAPIWPDKLTWADGAERGAIVQAIGDISVYTRGSSTKRQLTLTAPVRVLPKEGVDFTQFLPSVGDCTKLWDWVDKQRTDMQSDTLKRVLALFFDDDAFRVQFERTPGSPRSHHAQLGGLLLHVFEVASIGKHTARTMRANADLVLTGALLHDIGKVEAYEVGPNGFTVTPTGNLLGHVVLGTLMLERAIAKLPAPICSSDQLLELHHMILSHHGSLEFGSPVQPMTLEAEILHWADESSAKAADMADSLDDADAFASNSQISDTRPWRVGRKIWRRPHKWE